MDHWRKIDATIAVGIPKDTTGQRLADVRSFAKLVDAVVSTVFVALARRAAVIGSNATRRQPSHGSGQGENPNPSCFQGRFSHDVPVKTRFPVTVPMAGMTARSTTHS
ncbi:MAG TPA: hypothetical protein VFG83_13730 [Kofleriaceae bacterium]|nr:hypothetical protein [Kofleriaceae bacterium]